MGALLPVVSPEDLAERDRILGGFLAVLVPGVDYDPGGEGGLFERPSLLQPGAEKLAMAFGLRLVPRISHREEDLAGDNFGEPYVLIEATVDAYAEGELVGAGIGLATSLDPAHRYRWVTATEVPAGLSLASLPERETSVSEPLFAVEKAETGGKWGKPIAYWKQFQDAIAAGAVERTQRPSKAGEPIEWVTVRTMTYRIPNPDVFGLLNSLVKMAVKRAKVAAVISAIGGLSALFTQDAEDMPAGMVRRQPHAPAQDDKRPTDRTPERRRGRAPDRAPVTSVPDWPSVVHDEALVLTPAVWALSGLAARMVKDEKGFRRPVKMRELTEAEMTALAGMQGTDDPHVLAVADAAAEALQGLDSTTTLGEV